MITKRTIIDQIELTRHNTVQVRFLKLIEEDGVPLTEGQYHRTSFAPDSDPLLQMASVNEHLESMGLAPVSDDEMATIATVHATMATVTDSPVYRAALTTIAKRRAAHAPR